MKFFIDKLTDTLKEIANEVYFEDEIHIIKAEKILETTDKEIVDDIFIDLGVNIEIYQELSPKVILKKILSYLHESRNLFFLYYEELLDKEDILKIRVTNLRIIISVILKYAINSNMVIMSHAKFENTMIEIEIAELENILLLGYINRPPFRAKIVGDDKLTYFNETNINKLITGLKKKMKQYDSVERLKRNQMSTITNYAKKWWSTYREYIDSNYYEMRKSFRYYDGVQFNYVACKSNFKSEAIDVSSGLALVEMKTSRSDGFGINIQKDIQNMYELIDDAKEYTVTLGYKLEPSEDESFITIEKIVNDELLELMNKSNVEEFFEIFLEVVLTLFGYDKYKFDDYYIKRNLTSNKASQVRVIKLKDRFSMDFKELRSMLVDGQQSETIVISYDVIPSYLRNEFHEQKNITFLDKDTLLKSLKYKINESPISRLLVNQLIVPNFKNLIQNNEELKANRIADLIISDLQKCPEGSGWREYESICYKVIRYLFEDNFSYFKAEYQVANENRTDIRDLIIANTGKHEFWQSVKQIYKSNNIIFEFKNYSDKIDNDALRQISDYLEKDVYGQFGVIFTRNEVSHRTKLKQVDYLNNRNKKLILIISDEILIDMIKIKKNGGYPENILMDLKFKIETAI